MERFDWRRQAREMVEVQIAARGVQNPAVLEAMASLPRHLFMPKQVRAWAYEDTPVEIGKGQTISQPYMVARMTELMDPRPGERFLEIGTGSGYQAAVLAFLGVEVYSVERIEGLATRARRLLRHLRCPVRVIAGDGRLGYEEGAPYDGILVTAAAEEIESAWMEQLALNGRLLVPLRLQMGFERLLLRRKTPVGVLDFWHDYCRFVPLLPGTERSESSRKRK